MVDINDEAKTNSPHPILEDGSEYSTKLSYGKNVIQPTKTEVTLFQKV